MHKAFVQGTHRTRDPAETLRDYGRHLVDFGITRLANVTGLDRIGIPVYQAIRPNARSLSVSQGKGLTALAAKASAMMESIENWHAERPIGPLRYESVAALAASEALIDVDQLPLRPGGVLRRDLPMLWIEGRDLLTSRPVWVPFEFVHMNTVLPVGAALTFFNSSNGLASGNHLLEATLHALYEVIERDAISLWRLQSQDDREAGRIDPDTVEDGDCRALVERFRRAGISLALWEITSDLGIPCYACVVADDPDTLGGQYPGIDWGYGCHLSAEIALGRALTEAAQSRVTVIAGGRDDNPHAVYQTWESGSYRQRQARLHFGPGGGRPFSPGPSRATATFEGDLDLVLQRLRTAGLSSVAAVDLTHPRYQIPVVKTIVPGMELLLHNDRPQLHRRARAVEALQESRH
jgi:YcaO-like protein with predicted kinase domain